MKLGQVSIGVATVTGIGILTTLFGFVFAQINQTDAKANDAIRQTANVTASISEVKTSVVQVQTDVKWLTAVISKQYGIPLPSSSNVNNE